MQNDTHLGTKKDFVVRPREPLPADNMETTCKTPKNVFHDLSDALLAVGGICLFTQRGSMVMAETNSTPRVGMSLKKEL